MAAENKMMFTEVSAKTGENVDDCFLKITHEIYKKVDQGEYDLSNESLGITPVKAIQLKNPSSTGDMGRCGC